MDTGVQSQSQSQEMSVPKDMKKQLALAVRGIQWSYGIFWSISASQPGVLEWGDGYYNGDIKTRKTVQAMEFNADHMELQRSEQLRELYESLAAGESGGQTKRPSAALSPEDLTDTEWYYLVCMSFVFDVGQGLPGRTLSTGQAIWVRDAGHADSKVFTRSLLAKSASIQTVVCFPFGGGVIELGVTDMVSEDPSLIHHVKTAFLEIPYPTASLKSNAGCDEVFGCDNADIKLIPVMGDIRLASPTASSNEFIPNQTAEESFMVDRINGAASQVHSWKVMDEDFSDCISQTLVEAGNEVSAIPKDDERLPDDLHYQTILSHLLKTPDQLTFGSRFQRGKRGSSFETWRKGSLVDSEIPRYGTQQKVLKRILFEVPRMHDICLVGSPLDNVVRDGVWKPEADEIDLNHMLSERKRRERINERFHILKSMVPLVSKVDKVSVLDDTIKYLKELKRRVVELESCRQPAEIEAKSRKLHDAAERTSDNYGESKLKLSKRKLLNKRKTLHEPEEMEPEADVTNNLMIRINEKDVLIEMKCTWREGLLLEIITAASNLHLDSHSVQTSTCDGILSVTIKSKFAGSVVPSAGVIRQAMWRFAQT